MSTIDRRRRLGPATAIPLSFPPSNHSTNTDNIDSTNDTDKLFIQLSNIPTATGSSFIQSGNNILLASVYGPRPSFKRTFNSKAVLKITFTSSPFLASRESLNNNKNQPSNTSTTTTTPINDEYQIVNSVISSTLEDACANLILLNQYPKSTIDIFVNLINTDNKTKFIELLALIHNAVNLALVDSGIALKNFPSAIFSKNDGIFLNSIHSDNYDNDPIIDLENEELLTFYIPKLYNNDSSIHDDLRKPFQNTIQQSRSLRAELSQFCYNNL